MIMFLKEWIDVFNRLANRLSSWLLVFIGFIIFVEVFFRYIFLRPTLWVDEISRLALVWSIFLSLTFYFKKKKHITVEIFFTNENSLVARFIKVFRNIMIAFFSAIIIYYSFQMVSISYSKSYAITSVINIPKYLTYLSVLVGFSTLFLQSLYELLVEIKKYFKI